MDPRVPQKRSFRLSPPARQPSIQSTLTKLFRAGVLHPNRHHRHIVGLLGLARECVRGFSLTARSSAWRKPAACLGDLLHFGFLPHFALGIGRLADSVGETQHRVARRERNLSLLVFRASNRPTGNPPLSRRSIVPLAAAQQPWGAPGRRSRRSVCGAGCSAIRRTAWSTYPRWRTNTPPY